MSSFYEELQREALEECVIRIADETFVVPYPSSDDVAALDSLVRPSDILDTLAGEEMSDEILELLEDEPISVLNEVIAEIRSHYACLTPSKYGFAKIVEEIDLYGESIERDLLDLNLDLYEWFRDHDNLPWDKLFRILDRLPEGGYYNSARLADIELAQQIAAAQDRGELPKPTRRPPIVGWTRDRDTMLQVLETLERIEHGIYVASPKFKRAGGAKPRRKARPAFAADRVRRFNLYIEHDEIASAVLGSRYSRKVTDSDGNVTATVDFLDDGDI